MNKTSKDILLSDPWKLLDKEMEREMWVRYPRARHNEALLRLQYRCFPKISLQVRVYN